MFLPQQAEGYSNFRWGSANQLEKQSIEVSHDYMASSAFVISCFQVTLLHRHPHDTRHWLHTKLLHSLRENHTKSIAGLWPNPPTLYLETFTKSDCLIAWVQIYRAGDIRQPCGSSSQLGFALPCSTRMYNSTAHSHWPNNQNTTRPLPDHSLTTARLDKTTQTRTPLNTTAPTQARQGKIHSIGISAVYKLHLAKKWNFQVNGSAFHLCVFVCLPLESSGRHDSMIPCLSLVAASAPWE